MAVSVIEVRAPSSLALGGAAARAPSDRGKLGAAVGLVARLDVEADRGVGDGRARSRPR